MVEKCKELFKKYEEIIVYLIVGVANTIVSWVACFLVGLVFGYVMEKEAKKSIIPGIVAHASYNIVSSAILLFV